MLPPSLGAVSNVDIGTGVHVLAVREPLPLVSLGLVAAFGREVAEVVAPDGEIASGLGAGGVGFGQALADGQRLLEVALGLVSHTNID